jgi:hypothetical protein
MRRPEFRRVGTRIVLMLIDLVLLATAVSLVFVGRATPEGQPESGSSAPEISVDGVPGLPPSAATCEVQYTEVTTPYNAGARGTPMTSCPFVEQVRRAYASDSRPGSPDLPVVSPQTGKRYTMACVPTGSYATCTGAVGAVIYLYNTPS